MGIAAKGFDRLAEGELGLSGETAMHWAFARGRPEAARKLKALGADPRPRDKMGRLPVHWIAAGTWLGLEGKRERLRECLILWGEWGGSLEERDGRGMSPLEIALACFNRDVAQALLDRGAGQDPGLAGMDPMEAAWALGYDGSMLERLAEAGCPLPQKRAGFSEGKSLEDFRRDIGERGFAMAVSRQERLEMEGVAAAREGKGTRRGM